MAIRDFSQSWNHEFPNKDKSRFRIWVRAFGELGRSFRIGVMVSSNGVWTSHSPIGILAILEKSSIWPFGYFGHSLVRSRLDRLTAWHC